MSDEPDPLEAVYDELRRLAARRMASESAGHSLSPTALVHEAWARLAAGSVVWNDRNHFLRLAAVCMRRILVDHARRRGAAKRGGGTPGETLDDVAQPERSEELLALDEALGDMALERPDHARLVELRFFGGLSSDEAAQALGVSASTADRMWRYARGWLQIRIAGDIPRDAGN